MFLSELGTPTPQKYTEQNIFYNFCVFFLIVTIGVLKSLLLADPW